MPNKVKLVHPHSKFVVTFNLSFEIFFRPIQITLVFSLFMFSLINFCISQEYLEPIVRSAYWDMKISIAKFQRGDPLSLLKGRVLLYLGCPSWM